MKAAAVSVTLVDKVEHAVTSLGVLLVLATIFTSVQSQTLNRTEIRNGSLGRWPFVQVGTISLALAVITAAALIALLSLASQAIGDRSDPSINVFILVWVLLVPLLAWQLVLVVSAVILWFRNR